MIKTKRNNNKKKQIAVLTVMSSSTNNRQKDYACPQCHQEMSNMDMLQNHLQTVHKKPSSTNTKGMKIEIGHRPCFFVVGILSLVKQKIKTVQDDLKPSNEPAKVYAQYFSPSDSYSKIGYLRSCDDYFRQARTSRIEYLLPITRQTLLYMELLTTINEHIPRNGNTKERLSRSPIDQSLHLYSS